MSIEFYIGQGFDTTHERTALKRFLSDMQKSFGTSHETYHVIANCTVLGNQIDLTVIKPGAIIVVELKDCGEAFRATENGPWITYTSDSIIGTGTENPFEQLNRYRKRWMSYLNDRSSRILSSTRQTSFDFAHVSAFVCISPNLNPACQNDIPWLPWFRLVGLSDLCLSVYQQTSSKLQFTDDEIRKLIADLNIQKGDINFGMPLDDLISDQIKPGSAPPIPQIIVGRDVALQQIRTHLGVPISVNGTKRKAPNGQTFTIIRGWPGVGKTTMAAAIAHDPLTQQTFRHGVLWASMGESPSIISHLTTWAKALGITDISPSSSITEISTRITARLREKRMLLILDDIWEVEHAVPFFVGGNECAILITTRFNSVAESLVVHPQNIIKLDILDEKSSLTLLSYIAPEVVENHHAECRDLVRDLEGLPLAIHVAGRLLNEESKYGWGVKDLLLELREGATLLEAKAPADRSDIETQTTPTVSVLLKKSTDRLDPETRDYFAFLGVFAPKPATFDLVAIAIVWGVKDPRSTIRILVNRGLLEPIGGRFQMHALLVLHAKSLFKE